MGEVLWLALRRSRRSFIGQHTMIYVHSLGRAFRYYTQRTALVVDGAAVSFKALHERVQNIAAALVANGFAAGDRLALLLPNSPEYIELVYACSWLGVDQLDVLGRIRQQK